MNAIITYLEQYLVEMGMPAEVVAPLLAVLGGMLGFIILYILAVTVISLISNWKIFKKAGEPGWKCLIPIYSDYIRFKRFWSTGKFWKYLILSIIYGVIGNLPNIPVLSLILSLAGLVISIITLVMQIKLISRTSQSFGHGTGFTLGLIFLPFIFNLVLAFGKSEYEGPIED